MAIRVRLEPYGFNGVTVDMPALPRPGDHVRPEFFAPLTPTGRVKGFVLVQVVSQLTFFRDHVVVSLRLLDDSDDHPERSD